MGEGVAMVRACRAETCTTRAGSRSVAARKSVDCTASHIASMQLNASPHVPRPPSRSSRTTASWTSSTPQRTAPDRTSISPQRSACAAARSRASLRQVNLRNRGSSYCAVAQNLLIQCPSLFPADPFPVRTHRVHHLFGLGHDRWPGGSQTKDGRPGRLLRNRRPRSKRRRALQHYSGLTIAPGCANLQGTRFRTQVS